MNGTGSDVNDMENETKQLLKKHTRLLSSIIMDIIEIQKQTDVGMDELSKYRQNVVNTTLQLTRLISNNNNTTNISHEIKTRKIKKIKKYETKDEIKMSKGNIGTCVIGSYTPPQQP